MKNMRNTNNDNQFHGNILSLNFQKKIKLNNECITYSYALFENHTCY